MGEHIRPGMFIVAANLADGIRMNLVVSNLCYLYSGLRDIMETGLQEYRIGEELVYFPLQYLCAWLGLHFLSFIREEREIFVELHISTL